MIGQVTLDEAVERWDSLTPVQRRERVRLLAEDQQRHLDAVREHGACAEILAESRARNSQLLTALGLLMEELERHERETRLTERGELHARRLRRIVGDAFAGAAAPH